LQKNNIKINSNRSFGIVFFLVFLIFSIYPVSKSENIIVWSLILSIIFLILGLFNSSILTPFNKLWFKFGIFLGKIVSPIVMGLVFFLVVTPTGLLLRFLGKDVLNLKKNKKNTYWIEKNGPKSIMKNQF
tara:strand:- start:56 stop:445 length:390 start_codon:yes stop_codon:yes gene_type:complete